MILHATPKTIHFKVCLLWQLMNHCFYNLFTLQVLLSTPALWLISLTGKIYFKCICCVQKQSAPPGCHYAGLLLRISSSLCNHMTPVPHEEKLEIRLNIGTIQKTLTSPRSLTQWNWVIYLLNIIGFFWDQFHKETWNSSKFPCDKKNFLSDGLRTLHLLTFSRIRALANCIHVNPLKSPLRYNFFVLLPKCMSTCYINFANSVWLGT